MVGRGVRRALCRVPVRTRPRKALHAHGHACALDMHWMCTAGTSRKWTVGTYTTGSTGRTRTYRISSHGCAIEHARAM